MRGVDDGSVIRQVGQGVEEGPQLRVSLHQIELLILGFAVAVIVEGCDDVVHGGGLSLSPYCNGFRSLCQPSPRQIKIPHPVAPGEGGCALYGGG